MDSVMVIIVLFICFGGGAVTILSHKMAAEQIIANFDSLHRSDPKWAREDLSPLGCDALPLGSQFPTFRIMGSHIIS
jgi:hypothetical protein